MIRNRGALRLVASARGFSGRRAGLSTAAILPRPPPPSSLGRLGSGAECVAFGLGCLAPFSFLVSFPPRLFPFLCQLLYLLA